MRLHIFSDRIACFEGDDAGKVICNKSGVLKIGEISVDIPEEETVVIPTLFDGVFCITFTDKNGNVYKCADTRVKNGRVALINTMSPGEIELRYRCEKLERDLELLTTRVEAIEKEYDFNALNFLSAKETEEN